MFFAGYNEAPTIELYTIPRYYTEVFSVFLQLKSFKDLALILEMPLIYEILVRLASLTFTSKLGLARVRR